MIFNADCFDVFPTIAAHSIDLVLVDLPYGQTACEWDLKIDLVKMWQQLQRIGKEKCQFIFFTTTKFGVELINSNPRFFRYDLVWEKAVAVGYLCANKMPLRAHEMIYVFSRSNSDDLENVRNLAMREYAKRVLQFIGKSPKTIAADMGNRAAEHFLQRVSTTQFGLPTRKTYEKLIELYAIDKMEGFILFDDLTPFKKTGGTTYNAQKTKGKPYKARAGKGAAVYGIDKVAMVNETGDRHPRSVLKFHQSDEHLHPTQKPVELCEWLVRAYSNEGDTVLDFCMGSGTTMIACKNSGRHYIGIEKDPEIFGVAEKRINEHQTPA